MTKEIRINREYLTKLYNDGLNLKDMKTQILKDYQNPISDADLRTLYTKLDLNLRKRPRPSRKSTNFVLDDNG